MPLIIVICGLPGSGKSFFAQYLAESLQITRLSTDEIRADLKKQGSYDETTRLQVYQEMMARALPVIKTGQSVILEGSFNNALQRQEVLDLAQQTKSGLKWLRLVVAEELALTRVSKKREFTEADVRVYHLLKESWEPLKVDHMQLDSGTATLESLLERSLVFLELPHH